MCIRDRPFLAGELSRFFQNVVRDAQFADVVQQCRAPQLLLVRLTHAEMPGNIQCGCRDAVGMLVRERRLGVDDVRERQAYVVDRGLVRDQPLLHRLERQDVLQKLFGFQTFPQALVRTQRLRSSNQFRIKPPAATLLHRVNGGIRPSCA